ncbi:pyruvate dehydrogenase E1 component subunit alpha, mitochondrial isoform X2 [Drosophila albomicans]|uniref:Pyruvate dehydrogenase E1 component subunit alpha n=1 Tax=Drosophila albomicans TaxID=7291 RepID=A0A9C6TAU4_DROAB|nr:pyruvate dehydrogenase E1 component subunit alpha, mitochondrial isoform X2 [Drosophila albomicans]
MEKIKFDLKESEKQFKMVEKKLLKVFLEKEKLQDDKVKAETILKSRIHNEEKSAEEIEKLKDDLKKSQDQFEVVQKELQEVSLKKKELQRDKDEADTIIRSRIQSEEKSAKEIEKLMDDLKKSQDQFEVLKEQLQKNAAQAGVAKTNNYATEATVQVNRPFKLHRLDEGPETTVQLTKDEALKYYTQMQTIRRIETAAGNLYKEKIIRGFCHLYSGQEACAVGMKAAMRDVDNIISAYRVHGWTYLMGVSPLGVLAELTGMQSGCARGKGGSMHMYSPNFYGGNGIVGAQVPLGAGVGLACKYKGNGGMCLALYGDGAANQGQVFEAYNMAYLWKLPVIFVCENNNYGMGTSAERASCNTDYYTRGDALPGIWVDGMDVLAVRSATEFAIKYVNTHGPLVMETNTYRYSGHSMSDPGTSYRTREEIQEVRQKRDPITSFKELCIELGLITTDEIKAIDMKVRKEVDEATAIAKTDTELPLPHLWTDVYSNNLERKIRGTIAYDIDHIQERKGVNH